MSHQRISLTLATITFVAMCLGILLPHGGRLLPWYNPTATHILAFAGLAFLLTVGINATFNKTLAIVAALIVIGAATELLQQFSPGRQPHIFDVALNGIGATAGGFFGWATGLFKKYVSVSKE